VRDFGETVLGAAWRALVWAWGAVLAAIVLLFPLGAAIAIDAFARDYPPALVLGAGIGLAYVLAISPWNADSPRNLPVAMAASAASWVGWTLIGGGGPDLVALAACPAVAAAGWVISRFVTRRRAVNPG
jgi:hypothetical protein